MLPANLHSPWATCYYEYFVSLCVAINWFICRLSSCHLTTACVSDCV